MKITLTKLGKQEEIKLNTVKMGIKGIETTTIKKTLKLCQLNKGSSNIQQDQRSKPEASLKKKTRFYFTLITIYVICDIDMLSFRN